MRPPIATRRRSIDDVRLVYRCKQPFQDGSTHVLLKPLDFMATLAALALRARLKLTRFRMLSGSRCALQLFTFDLC